MSYLPYSLGASVVVVFCSAACGGDAENSSNSADSDDSSAISSNNTGSQATTDGGTTTQNVANANGTGGTSSDSSGAGTSDGTTGETSGGTTAATTDGGGDCPSVEPAVGTACSAEGHSCQFNNCVSPNYRDDHELTCVGGAWAITSLTVCDDTGTTCPSSPPAVGQTCEATLTPGPCSTIDACGDTRALYCIGEVWSYTATSAGERVARPSTSGTGIASTAPSATAVTTTGGGVPVPLCPVDAPFLGTTCCPADYPSHCSYSTSQDLVPATGGASGQAVSTAIATGSSITGTTGNGGSPGSGGAEPQTADCVVCGDDMLWASSLCP